jgi:hypothetical protein
MKIVASIRLLWLWWWNFSFYNIIKIDWLPEETWASEGEGVVVEYSKALGTDAV